MKINQDTILIKAHYFLFFAGLVPVMPFFMVIGVGLGVPIALQGLVGATVLVGTVFAKPMLSLLADSFPGWRKGIFVAAVLSCGLALSSICFVPTFGRVPYYPRAWLISKTANLSSLLELSASGEGHGAVSAGLSRLLDGNVTEQGNGSSFAELPGEFSNSSRDEETADDLTWSDVFLFLPTDSSCEMQRGVDCHLVAPLTPGEEASPPPAIPMFPEAFPTSMPEGSSLLQLRATEGAAKGVTPYTVVCQQEGARPSRQGRVGVWCRQGEWSGQCEGQQVWRTRGFWGFFTLLLLGLIAFSTANSFTDAVTVETIGPTGNYGSQRAWGSAGWGLMGPVSGLLVDWWSGPSEVKDYTPAFLLVFLIMGADVALSARLKVPKLEVNRSVWTSVWPLLRQPRFFLFLFFSILNGCFDGVVLNFLFVLQEDMAAGSDDMQHIKFLQGMTLFVQCATEVPCMYLSHRLVRRIGADRVTTMVLGLHVIRLFLVTSVGRWGSVWMTVAVEIFNGPCYGFGYTAIVVYAGQLAPLGASTTVQSLANLCYESIGYAVCSLLSGLIVQKLGSVQLFFIWGSVAIVTTVFHMIYVQCVPPIKQELINPPLRKRGEETDGTVEEQLFLSAGVERDNGCSDPVSTKDAQQPRLLQDRARQTEGLEDNEHSPVDSSHSDVPAPPLTRSLELGVGVNDGEVIAGVGVNGGEVIPASDKEGNGFIRQASNDIIIEVTGKIICECRKIAGAAPNVGGGDCLYCLGESPVFINGAAGGEWNGGGGVPGERQRVGKCREDVREARLTNYLYVSNV